MNKKIIKVTSSLLLATMVAYTTPTFAFTKEETVYSKTKSNGETYQTIVSTHLKNGDEEDILKDLTDLINIENTNGDETFTQNGEELTWNANGSDIYYQGESKKELPIKCKITYTLDGKEISAEDLAGKSGKVKITIEYENEDAHEIYINGRKQTLYTPFTVVCGTIFQNTENKNIEITNGKIVNDGTKTMVLGIALPGMQESLNISNKTVNLPNKVEISMETSKFEQNNIITFVTPKIFDESISFDKLNELYSKVNEIQNASKQLEEGANALKEGTAEFADKSQEFNNAMKQLETGTTKLNSGVDAVSAGLDELGTGVSQGKTKATTALAASAKTLSEGIDKIIEGKDTEVKTIKAQVIEGANAELKKGLTTTTTDANGKVSLSVGDGAKQIAAGTLQGVLQNEQFLESAGIELTDAQKIALVSALKSSMNTTTLETEIKNAVDTVTAKQEAGLDLINNNEAGVKAGLTTLKTQAGANINAGIKQITDGFDEISTGVSKISKGTDNLKSGTATLASSTKMLVNANDSLTAASVDIKDGAYELATGVEKFNTEAINKICSYINSDVKDIATRAEKLQELAEEYEGFSKSSEDTNKETKFIIVTDSIKAKKDEQEENN